jgi:uncharacterized protein
MHLSRHTIFVPVPEREDLALVQPLTGQVALLERRHVKALLALPRPPPSDFPADELRDGSFVVDSDAQERELLSHAYADFLEEADRTPTQLILVPTFGCNLRCTYCYQEPFEPEGRGLISAERVEGFFAYVDRFHGTESPRPYLTLFGGEPLVDLPPQKERIGQILQGARARGMPVAVVTNGFDLPAYLPLLGQGGVREVQVTLDGPAELHDRRRPHKSLGATFERVVQGIDALIDAQIPVNLRVVVDKENLEGLPALAALAEARGWLALPEARFKTQLGRNYELFGCASRQASGQLFSRVELWTRYVELAQSHPVLARFHKPRFHGVRHLAETGQFPAPNFDACPAAKKEWAFGPDGLLYGCTATVGHPSHRLGRYAPNPVRDEAAIGRWRERNACTIPKCQRCELAPLCGGGCAAIAHQQHGELLAPDCRPVRELLGLGLRYYRLGE